MRRLEEATMASQNISTVRLCHTYQADLDRLVFVRFFINGVTGGGDYTAYITVQRLGEGGEFTLVPITVTPVDSGVSAISMTTIPLPVHQNDRMRVYLKGLVTDTSVSVGVEVWEDDNNWYITAPGDYPSGSIGRAIANLGINPTIHVYVPIMDNTKLEIVRGDDYTVEKGRALTFSSESWPDITSASVEFVTNQFAVAAEVTGAQSAQVELTGAQTGILAQGWWSLVATFPDQEVVSLIPKAKVNVIDPVDPPEVP